MQNKVCEKCGTEIKGWYTYFMIGKYEPLKLFKCPNRDCKHKNIENFTAEEIKKIDEEMGKITGFKPFEEIKVLEKCSKKLLAHPFLNNGKTTQDLNNKDESENKQDENKKEGGED